MTDTKHTEGQLAITVDLDGDYSVTGADKSLIMHDTMYYPFAPNIVDANRIVACWNAMQGIDDPEAFMLVVAGQRAAGIGPTLCHSNAPKPQPKPTTTVGCLGGWYER